MAGASLLVAAPHVAAATSMSDLGTLPGGTMSLASGINPVGR